MHLTCRCPITCKSMRSTDVTKIKLLLQTSEKGSFAQKQTAEFCREPTEFFILSTAPAFMETLGLSLALGRTTVNSLS